MHHQLVGISFGQKSKGVDVDEPNPRVAWLGYIWLRSIREWDVYCDRDQGKDRRLLLVYDIMFGPEVVNP